MDTISKTNVHYIRCIKPNESKVAWGFEPNMVLSQLRACGVLETIRISCAGYPSRWTFEDFADRFYALVNSQYWDPNLSPDINKLCRVILDKYITDSDKFQIGLTKIFFRAGQVKKKRRRSMIHYVLIICLHSLPILKNVDVNVGMNVPFYFKRTCVVSLFVLATFVNWT
jgi:myosin heavy subunit